MDTTERINAGTFRSMLSEIVDRVRSDRKPVIIRRNNRDQVAVVPLEMLRETEKKKKIAV